MEESKFIRLNTVVLPDDKLLPIALDLAEAITRGKTEIYHVDNQKYFAHVTIYAPEYPSKNCQTVLSVVRDFANHAKPIKLVFDSFYVGDGYIGITFKRTAAISQIHKTLLSKLNSLREGRLRDKYQSEIATGKYPPYKVAYIQKYGYQFVLSAYEPHLTLARLTNQNDTVAAQEMLEQITTIPDTVASKLGVLCEAGPDGTYTKILEEFSLAGN